MLALVSLTTYSVSPLAARLIGSFPCDETTRDQLRPDAVTLERADAVVSAFTTNSSLPFAVRLTEPEESTIGKPNGAGLAIPLPPVERPCAA